MDFYEPVSDLSSVSPESLNSYLVISCRILCDRSGVFEDRHTPVDFSLRLPSTPANPPGNSGSVTLGLEMAFQRRFLDGRNGQFVDIRVPDGATMRDVWEWIDGLGDPLDMDPYELYVSFASPSYTLTSLC